MILSRTEFPPIKKKMSFEEKLINWEGKFKKKTPQLYTILMKT